MARKNAQPTKAKGHRAAAPRRALTRIATPVEPHPAAVQVEAAVQPVAAPAAPPTPASAPGMAGRLVGFGLQVAAVPFVVPLFLTAAVSRHLGVTDR